MNVRLFLLAFILAAAVLPGRTAEADTPSTAPDASPASTAQYAYVTKPTAKANDDPSLPQIFEVDLNAQQLNAPGPFALRVLTSANVSAVYVHVEGQTFGIPVAQSGQFALAGTLPTMPSYMKGRNYNFDFEAMTTAGKRTQVDVPVFITP